MGDNATRTDERILDALAAGDELGIEALVAAIGQDVARRTLQRHVAALVDAGRLRAIGRARARRYALVAPASPERSAESAMVPASPEGEELRRYVRRPRTERRPVGYERQVLDAYVPGTTAYLSPALRAHLAAIGRREDAERPAGTYARQILERLLIDLSWASSRLEGNTYSLLDTRELLQFGRVAAGHDARETQMLLNHKAAIEMLVEDAPRIGFDPMTFRNLHALLADNLLPDPHAGGRLRVRPVEISGSVFVPLAVPSAIEECFRVLLEKAAAISDAFEQAFFVMVHLPYLQPFDDVNKRVSRLGANIPFVRANLSPLSFVDVPEQDYIEGTLAVYETGRMELLRDVFVWAYERSAQRYGVVKASLVDPDPFRLAHREAIRTVVAEVVRANGTPTAEVVERLGRPLVPHAALARLVDLVIDDLRHLHEGNVARYGLRPSELAAWTAGAVQRPD
ncbi:MAG: Fic family protein [Alphaproteobacteria bacterium]|nr:Fic family protein [Alphaproteobacteria bacterium]